MRYFHNKLILNDLAKCDARIFGTEVKYAVPCIKTIFIEIGGLVGKLIIHQICLNLLDMIL